MTEITPTESTRRRARREQVAARAASLVVTAALAGAALLLARALSPEPVSALVAVLPVAAAFVVLLAISPAGTLVSAFTMWSGYWVNSCPHCSAVSIDKMKATYARCDACGDEVYDAAPVARGVRVTRRRQGEPERHYCSLACAGRDDE